MVDVMEIVAGVKRKRELQGLDDEYVLRHVQEALKHDKRLREQLARARDFEQLTRSDAYKEFQSKVRADLRVVFGAFKEQKSKAAAQAETPLEQHQSSRERLAHYAEVYERIFAITGKPGAIVDLGCGANPYAYADLGCAPKYIAIDLPNRDLDKLKTFFAERAIDGEAHGVDLVTGLDWLREFMQSRPVHVAFLFKLLDSLETAKRHISGELLDAVNAAWLVVSFPTMSLGGGKHIKAERRAWFEKLLARKGWEYETFSIPNEMFYVVRKTAA